MNPTRKTEKGGSASHSTSFDVLLTSAMQAAFAKPQFDLSSAWSGHIHLMFSLITLLKPRVFVELGVHHGASFFAACQAVQQMSLRTRCFGIDHWEGDPHAGEMGDDVFEAAKSILDSNFSNFASFLRKSFDEAVADFEDGSIDLLHIDGYHSYEAVSGDFNTWKPKLSERSIVIFHDVNEYRGSFGAWRFWREVSREFDGRAYALGNDHGLGVLFFGDTPSEAVAQLLNWFQKHDGFPQVQTFFAELSHNQKAWGAIRGSLAREKQKLREENEVLRNRVKEREESLTKSNEAIKGSTQRISQLEVGAKNFAAEKASMLVENKMLVSRVEELAGRLGAVESERDGLAVERDRVVMELERLRGEWDSVVDEVSRLVGERDGLLSRVEELAGRLGAVESERDGLVGDRDGVVLELERLRGEWDTVAGEREGLMANVAKLEAALQRAETELEALAARNVELEASVADRGSVTMRSKELENILLGSRLSVERILAQVEKSEREIRQAWKLHEIIINRKLVTSVLRLGNFLEKVRKRGAELPSKRLIQVSDEILRQARLQARTAGQLRETRSILSKLPADLPHASAAAPIGAGDHPKIDYRGDSDPSVTTASQTTPGQGGTTSSSVTAKTTNENSAKAADKVHTLRPIVDIDWFRRRYSDELADEFATKGFRELPRGTFPNLAAETLSDSGFLLSGAQIMNPILANYPVNRWLRAFINPQQTDRVRNVDEYLSRAHYDPELLRENLTENELNVLGSMEWLKRRLHRDAIKAQHKDFVSVIMPSRKAEPELLRTAVLSVLMQTHRHLELIVVDNNEVADPNLWVLEELDPRIRVVDGSRAQGLAEARNLGLASAKAEIIAWQDDDDVWSPYCVSIHLDQLKTRRLDLVYSANLVMQGQLGTYGLSEDFKCVRYSPFRNTLLENRNFIGSQTMMHRRLVGGDEIKVPLDRFTDWAIALQVADLGRVGSMPIILNAYNEKAKREYVSDPATAAPALDRFRGWRSEAYRETVLLPKIYGYRRPLDYPHYTGRYAAVVPCFWNLELIARLLESVAESNDPNPPSWLLVNNTGSEEFTKDLESLVRKYELEGHVVEEKIPGFSRAVNAGIKSVAPDIDYAVLINTDAVLVDGCISQLVAKLDGSPDVGIVAPEQLINPKDAKHRSHWLRQHEDMQIGITLSAHHDNVLVDDWSKPEETRHLNFVPFFFVGIRLDDWRLLGGLNSDIGPHYTSDRVYCEALRRVRGKKISFFEGVRVFHEGGGSQSSAKELSLVLR